ncbi:MscS Mechanosensitive ion channel [Syntrophobotulus glycolicus DSM 8271]|uniref:MscS Mechanosensitive ion channel n=1 Tax=Syntrophobotulus glycolicus (strain DSM 8271 / FlGlyR) TaxID=645991 RepID=F0T041_SYNGF|nr:mechanosensitive ion channel family protein [Syntrophobotulus glycolicus]ADY56128.1 MscS Mechanosensitive ion channel [Syntrophobotulus glycolicus DSM 8271]
MVKNIKQNHKDFFHILLAFRSPALAFLIFFVLYLAIKALPYFDYSAGFEQILDQILRSLLILTIAWGLNNLESQSSFIFAGLSSKLQLNVDKMLIPFVSKILKFITWAFAFLIIIQEWGYNVNGLIAGLGLGGLAFALAAKDAVANIFGGVVIILDKPFTIGDWIVDGGIEGTVEDINFRSTKIRRADQALVTIPNSNLANSSIINQSKMGKKQVQLKLNLFYDTPGEKIVQVIAEIKEVLHGSIQIHQDNIVVTFNEISNIGLQVLINYFTLTTDGEQYLQIKEDINYKIIDILEKHHVHMCGQEQIRYSDNR